MMPNKGKMDVYSEIIIGGIHYPLKMEMLYRFMPSTDGVSRHKLEVGCARLYAQSVPQGLSGDYILNMVSIFSDEYSEVFFKRAERKFFAEIFPKLQESDA